MVVICFCVQTQQLVNMNLKFSQAPITMATAGQVTLRPDCPITHLLRRVLTYWDLQWQVLLA